MYEFVTGPLAWLSFGVFFIGIIVRAVLYVKGLNWQLDRVAYQPHLTQGLKGAARSIVFWLVPFGTHSWREKPGFTILFFIFHTGLLATPLLLTAHNILLKERWGFAFWSLPEAVTDVMTIMVILAAILIVLRRIALPEVRILTTAYDIALLAVAVAPFVTGLLAYHHVGNYRFWLIAHILSGELLLVAIPFTKLSHFILFFLTRAQLGMDFGIKRGGMKGKGFAW